MKTILIVDDEFDILSALKMIFTLEQYQVLTASNGRAALHVLTDNRPDLILTDWMMPEMDGIELCRLVRSDPKIARIPLIMMSAARSAPDGESHWNQFLSKPVEVEALLALVKQFLTD
jgi:CheY-like chemotaxis protein